MSEKLTNRTSVICWHPDNREEKKTWKERERHGALTSVPANSTQCPCPAAAQGISPRCCKTFLKTRDNSQATPEPEKNHQKCTNDITWVSSPKELKLSPEKNCILCFMCVYVLAEHACISSAFCTRCVCVNAFTAITTRWRTHTMQLMPISILFKNLKVNHWKGI